MSPKSSAAVMTIMAIITMLEMLFLLTTVTLVCAHILALAAVKMTVLVHVLLMEKPTSTVT